MKANSVEFQCWTFFTASEKSLYLVTLRRANSVSVVSLIYEWFNYKLVILVIVVLVWLQISLSAASLQSRFSTLKFMFVFSATYFYPVTFYSLDTNSCSSRLSSDQFGHAERISWLSCGVWHWDISSKIFWFCGLKGGSGLNQNKSGNKPRSNCDHMSVQI